MSEETYEVENIIQETIYSNLLVVENLENLLAGIQSIIALSPSRVQAIIALLNANSVALEGLMIENSQLTKNLTDFVEKTLNS